VGTAIRAVRAEPEGWNGSFDDRAEGYVFEGGSKKFAKYCDDIVVAIMIEKKSLYEQIEDVMNLAADERSRPFIS
jgi:2-keto-3-deoxy-L-rhamnonate aldolase RhmA